MHSHSWHPPLNCRCRGLFFMCKELLWSRMSLLNHSSAHNPLFPTADGKLWSPLHVKTRRPQQCAVVPKFSENSISIRFIFVVTCTAKAYLLIWLALLVEKEHIILRQSDPSSILSKHPCFVSCLEPLMMIVFEMHLSLPKQKKKMTARVFEANSWRQAGRTMAAESDDITPIGRLWEKTCQWQVVAIRADRPLSGTFFSQYQSARPCFFFHTSRLTLTSSKSFVSF